MAIKDAWQISLDVMLLAALQRKGWFMYNFSSKKNKKLFTSILIIVLVLAMVVPMVVTAVSSFM